MIVGFDVSSKRIDMCWLENGRPCRWHQILEGKHLIDRLRSIRIDWPCDEDGTPGADVQEVAIEMPFGQSRSSVAALMATVGVITRQAPSWARVAWPSSGELRTAIGAKNTKADAHQTVRGLAWPVAPNTRLNLQKRLYIGEPHILDGWNEHELDALVACIGWTRILAAQDAE